jgi:hypothetical protein
VDDMNIRRAETIEYKYAIAHNAIRRIVEYCGIVCDDFPDCPHGGCEGSYKAWGIALQALKSIEDVENGTITPIRTPDALRRTGGGENIGSNEDSGGTPE